MAYKGFTALFPLITTSYVSHVLLPAGVGRVSYANTIAAYFVLIASLGLPSYGVKAIAQSNVDKEQRSRTFWNCFLSILLQLFFARSHIIYLSIIFRILLTASRYSMLWD